MEAPVQEAPYWADIAFPILSFMLTIVMPSSVAVWVLWRSIQNVRKGGPKN